MPNPDYHRRSIRLQDHDYRQSGAYFVTLVAYQGEVLFGSQTGQQIKLNKYGQVIESCWRSLPDHFPVELDESIIMPNHFHAILYLYEDGKPECDPPLGNSPRALAGSLGTVIGYFKTTTARKINLMRRTPGQPVWQRNYFEHILRDSDDLEAIRRYIQENPLGKDDAEENIEGWLC